jgi:hypothetical protein
MVRDEEKTASPETATEAIKPKRSGIKYCCAACGIFLLMIMGGILLTILLTERSCESSFKMPNIPNIFQPSPSVTVPSGPWAPEDFSNLPDHVILDRYRDNLNIGVKPDAAEDDLRKLNSYLAQTYFTGLTVFNIAYFNKDNTSELIAVYSYNSFTRTDNFTMMEPVPGERYPANK